MAADYFLEIEGIKGESRDEKHKDMIDVESFSWGASQLSVVGQTGIKGEDMRIHHHIDKSSPVLMLSCATGKHIPKAVLFVRKASTDQGDYYQIKMTDVLVSSFSHGGEGGSVPLEEVAFNYAKIEFSYSQVKQGRLSPAITTGEISNIHS